MNISANAAFYNLDKVQRKEKADLTLKSESYHTSVTYWYIDKKSCFDTKKKTIPNNLQNYVAQPTSCSCINGSYWLKVYNEIQKKTFFDRDTRFNQHWTLYWVQSWENSKEHYNWFLSNFKFQNRGSTV